MSPSVSSPTVLVKHDELGDRCLEASWKRTKPRIEVGEIASTNCHRHGKVETVWEEKAFAMSGVRDIITRLGARQSASRNSWAAFHAWRSAEPLRLFSDSRHKMIEHAPTFDGLPVKICTRQQTCVDMADPISITLGVVPLVGLVIKSFAVLNKKLSTFMHYSSKVKRFQRRFRGQRRTFENECRILLSFAIDDATILLMEKDPAHESWADDSIDDCLKTKFGDSYGTCLETVQDIRETVEDIEIQLGGFDDLPECPVEVSHGKRAGPQGATLSDSANRAKSLRKLSNGCRIASRLPSTSLITKRQSMI